MTRAASVRDWGREWLGVGPCLLAACSFATVGCDPGGTECSCRPTGLSLQICPALADEVQEIQLSMACSTASKSIVDGGAEGGWTVYDIQPDQTGACSLEVFFKNGLTFTAGDITIDHGPGCCSGLYPDPLGASEIQACPETDAAADAEPDAEKIRDGAPGS
jgi:hypothetical protein